MRVRILVSALFATLAATGCPKVENDPCIEEVTDAAQGVYDGGGSDASLARCPPEGGSLAPAALSALGIDANAPLLPRRTSRVFLAVNLDVSALIPGAFDVTRPAAMSNFATPVTVYDSLGGDHQITTFFVKTSAHTWDWHAIVNGSEIEGGTSGVPFEGAIGTLVFNTDGALQTDLVSSSSWNFRDATAGQSIELDFGSSLDEGGTGYDGTTNFANSFVTVEVEQDGYSSGALTGAVVSGPRIVGTYSNGQTRVLGLCP